MTKPDIITDDVLVVMHAQRTGNPVMCLQAGTSTLPFFAFGFYVADFRRLAKHMGEDQTFYHFLPITFLPESYKRVEDIAAHYTARIREVQPHGPYCLGGFCFSGQLAYEIGCQLHAQGEEVALLAIFESYVGDSKLSTRSPLYFSRLTSHYAKKFVQIPWRKKFSYLRNVANHMKGKVSQSLVPEEPRHFDHSIRPYPGKLTLFQSSQTPTMPLYNPRVTHMGWGKYATGEMEVHEINGTHRGVLEEPGIIRVAHTLRNAIRVAERKMAEKGVGV